MNEVLLPSEICRLCLASAKTTGMDSAVWLFRITEQTQTKFEEITHREFVINEDQQLPDRMCTECSDKLESFYFYK